MKNELSTVKLHSIDAYNKIYGLETLHPLVTVIDLKKATGAINNAIVDYGVYALFLKNGVNCTLMYGRQPYDYQEGTVVSFAPGQLVTIRRDKAIVAPDVIGLMFHPDLIYGTPLADKIKSYAFFDYSSREALHLSADERRLFLECLDQIRTEISHPVDNHTAEIVASRIQVLLDYLARFYERQFITRHRVNSDIVRRFEDNLKNYYSSGDVDVVPSVNYFADKANLTPGYFGDLVKKETGRTAQDIISAFIVDRAKQKLASSSDDVAVIAYSLGFQYPQHFTRMFKRMTGVSPTVFRRNITIN